MTPGSPNGTNIHSEQWIPILDYAVLRGVSTSTLRRYIKAKKIKYRVENGRYLLLAESQAAAARSSWDSVSISDNTLDMSVYTRVRELEAQLSHAHEQITELKMLVAIYEEKHPE